MNPFPPGSLVALYLRDSGGDEQEMSIEQQRAALLGWLQQNGLRHGREFKDSVSGASTKGREDFLRLAAYFQHDPPEAGVLVWRTNRIGRNVDDVQYFKADLRRRGYIVHSLTDNIPEGHAGKLYEFVLDWKDEIFSAQLSEDVKRGLRDLVRNYGAVPGVPPRGFIRVPVTIGARRNGQPHIVHKWQPDPALIPTIQTAYEMRARGATLRSIQHATGLYKNKNCWVTFFSNPLYKGVLQFADITIETYCNPIVTPELWQAANDTGLARRHTPARSQARRLASSFLLSGLARCKCGALLTGKVIKQYRYYACSRRIQTGECDARQIPAEQVDKEVEQALVNHILSLENLMLIQARLQGEYTALQETVTQTKTDLTRRLSTVARSAQNLVAELAANGPSATIGQTLRALELEKADITARLKNIETQIAPPLALSQATMTEIAAQITAAITGENIEQKRYYLSAFIQQITLSREPDAIRGCITYHPPF